MDRNRLDKRKILITGGTRRIGLAISKHLHQQGAKLLVQSRSESEYSLSVATDLHADLLTFDLSDDQRIDSILHKLASAPEPLTDIIWSAATFEQIPFSQTTASDFDRIFADNCRSAFLMAQSAQNHCPHLQSITLFSDAWSKTLGAKALAHGLSKAMIEPLTLGLARILAPTTRVNAIRPGPILPAAEYTDAQNEASIRNTLTKSWGSPQEIAAAVELLLTSPSMTGSVLTIDGGRSALTTAADL